MTIKSSKWKFAVDRGGTFTDVLGLDPRGRFHVCKLLSRSGEYDDASIEGIRRLLGINSRGPLPTKLVEEIRFGTTVATNALLERKGGKTVLFVSKGFRDILDIGYQARSDIFALAIEKPIPLYSHVVEVDERVNSEGKIIRILDRERLDMDIKRIKKEGVESVAVVFMHSWRNPEHENVCREMLKSQGVTEIFLSHETINLIKIVSRGQSTAVDAYLSPVILSYVESIRRFTGDIRIKFIQSSGGLCQPERFLGKDALLSGPAGGVIGAAGIAKESGLKGVIGFDMGGTSTDVSRCDGIPEKIHEKTVEGITLQKEMLNIHTVASGGGSILKFDGQRMRVGPDSAGAFPGPACYGFGGPLTVTDANLITGRIVPDHFPKTFGPDRKSPLDVDTARRKFLELTDRINSATGRATTPEEAALGYLRIANEKMALAVKDISVSRGIDVRDYSLICFGGAGGQHVCRLAELLGMKQIVYHPLGGVLSAYGIGLSETEYRSEKTLLMTYQIDSHNEIGDLFTEMEKMIVSTAGLHEKGFTSNREIDLRTEGSERYITVSYGEYSEMVAYFAEQHTRLFGFFPEDGAIEAVNLRVQIREKTDFFPAYRKLGEDHATLSPTSFRKLHFRQGVSNTPLYLRESLPMASKIKGPAIIVDRYSTLVVDPGFEGKVEDNGAIMLTMTEKKVEILAKNGKKADPVLLEVFNNLFMSIATEMGHTLRNTAHSVNIKERLDFSCALFDAEGNLIANAPHIPVHLGAMSDSVKAVMEDQRNYMRSGDAYLTNNPYRGGSHLPDMTVICPVFSEGEILFYTAARGHHADVGGFAPGSIPSHSRHIDEEGIMVDGMLIMRDGIFYKDALKRHLRNHKYPARNMAERLSDFRAQIAACHKGAEELYRMVERYGRDKVRAYMGFIQQNAEYATKQALGRFLTKNDPFTAKFEDFLDDGSPVRVKITITGGIAPPETIRAVIDFTGTGPEHRDDNLNTPLAVARSAVLYVLRSLARADLPLNSGCLHPVEIIVPEGSLLNPRYPSSVASGNVETSQRIVDVLLGALGVAAASQGTMNNVLFKVEGDAPYYETIAGGEGASEWHHGASAVQVHMTNTRITDPEILEFRHPGVRLERFEIRKRSGGAGKWRGGDGVIRELKFLKPARVSVISERRNYAPYGTAGGKAGERGRNFLKRTDGSREEIGNRADVNLREGESIVVETPGGGGFGEES